MRRSPFPWARPRHEVLVLALLALAVLLPLQRTNVQDVSRLALTESVLHDGTLSTGHWGGWASTDRAVYHGRVYSDKAPGMSFLALPSAAAIGLPPPGHWHPEGDGRVWVVRALTSGIAFLLLAFVFGRVVEGIAPGTGAAATATLALGTLVGSLTATTFGHVTAAALGFAAFAAAWRGGRAEVVAGLLAGLAVLTDYPTFLVALVVAGYVLLRSGARGIARVIVGAVPAAVALGVYDTLAFGSPFSLSYRFVANAYAGDQHQGFFGIGVPHLHSLRLVLVGDRGLLVTSPVAVAAAVGLVLLWRRGLRLEALACGIVTLLLVVLNAGYFLPYGGTSPGPRFLVPALPFLFVGVGEAFRRLPVATTLLALVSALGTLVVTMSWSVIGGVHYRQTVWGELARLVAHGKSAKLAVDVSKSIPCVFGANRNEGAALVLLATAAALAVCLAPLRHRAR